MIDELNKKILEERGIDYNYALEKVKSGYPIQYIIGDVEFLDSTIKVNESVLIPRFETELLVDMLNKKIKELNLNNIKVLELGTGSGCISINISLNNVNSSITAVDISSDAIKVAKENALLNKVNNITFINDDMANVNFEGYDVLVSNPPYVMNNEDVGVETKFEPQIALFGGEDGLDFYRLIIDKLSNVNSKPIIIAFEIGMLQGNQIKDLFNSKLPMYDVSINKDLNGRDRFVFAVKIVK